jgi:hypothetical protein
MRYLLFIFPLLLLFSEITAQNYPTFPVGQIWDFPDARALALGGAGSVSLATPGALILNPASLVQIDHQLTADVSVNLRKFEERRSYPLYDRFDSFLTNATYAINNNWYPRIQGGIAVQLPGKILPGLILAAGIYPHIDYQYTYLEEVRENVFGDQLIAYNRIKGNGILQRYSLGAASEVPGVSGLTLGIQAGFLQGDVDHSKEINYVDPQDRLEIESQTRKSDNTPIIFSIGSIYKATERISTGIDLSLPYSVSFKSQVIGEQLNETIEYPLKANVGLEYRARQELQARLNVDIGYEFWSNSKYNTEIGGNVPVSQEFSDVLNIKVGIEHIFYNQIPFRVGAQYRTAYLASGTTQTLLAAGTGFYNGSWRIDLAGGFGRVTYRWEDLFDDALFVSNPNFQSRSELDTVDESTFLVQFSLKIFID